LETIINLILRLDFKKKSEWTVAVLFLEINHWCCSAKNQEEWEGGEGSVCFQHFLGVFRRSFISQSQQRE